MWQLGKYQRSYCKGHWTQKLFADFKVTNALPLVIIWWLAEYAQIRRGLLLIQPSANFPLVEQHKVQNYIFVSPFYPPSPSRTLCGVFAYLYNFLRLYWFMVLECEFSLQTEMERDSSSIIKIKLIQVSTSKLRTDYFLIKYRFSSLTESTRSTKQY